MSVSLTFLPTYVSAEFFVSMLFPVGFVYLTWWFLCFPVYVFVYLLVFVYLFVVCFFTCSLFVLSVGVFIFLLVSCFSTCCLFYLTWLCFFYLLVFFCSYLFVFLFPCLCFCLTCWVVSLADVSVLGFCAIPPLRNGRKIRTHSLERAHTRSWIQSMHCSGVPSNSGSQGPV